MQKHLLLIIISCTHTLYPMAPTERRPPYPYRSDILIAQQTARITNVRHRAMIINAMHRCSNVPQRSFILLTGNQPRKSFNPKKIIYTLNTIFPHLLNMRTQFSEAKDTCAVGEISIFILEMRASYEAAKDLLGLKRPTPIEEHIKKHFSFQ